MRYLLIVTLSSLAVACVSPGPPPGALTVITTPEIRYEPYSAEVLASPALQAIIAQCEARGWSDCDKSVEPTDDLRVFDRTKHSAVHTIVILSELTANRSYEAGWKLFDPRGELQSRYSFSADTPASWQASYTLDFRFSWSPINPQTWTLGRWRIEITVNGQLEAERSFEVIGSGVAFNVPRGLLNSPLTLLRI